MKATLHHLKNRPKTLEQRAKITASLRCNWDEQPEQWLAEYNLALYILKRREEIDSGKFLLVNA